ncbi:MAG: CDP-diacylglycerol--serine O-phosphatidyltransferase [Sphingobacteriaceae bacterium]
MKKHIPNTLTCLNLLSGCMGLVWAFEQHLSWAAYAIVLSAIFDFLDGMVARLLKAYSDIGKELDSLADVVSFGVLPAIIVFQLFKQSGTNSLWLPYLAFLIAIFSALRLAKFNVDTRQAESFIGLPTPANALLLGSFPLIIANDEFGIGAVIQQPYVLAVFCIMMSALLVAELPLLSLKFKHWSIKGNEFRFGLIILSVLLLLMLKFAAIPFIIGVYIFLSMIQTQFKK